MVVQNEMVLEFGSVLEGIFKKFYKLFEMSLF